MPNAGFYNENINRSYPFVGYTSDNDELPAYAVADVGVIMLASTSFEEGTNSVYLNSISRTGTTFTFQFYSDAPGLVGDTIEVTRDTTDERYLTDFNDGESVHLAESSSSEILCDGPLWELFFVSGDMEQLATLIGDGSSITGPWRLEPSLIQNLEGSIVRSVTVANADRTRAETPTECRDYCWPFDIYDYYVQCECLTGKILFGSGFNISLEQDSVATAITFEAGVGLGEGEPCADIALTDDEALLANRTTLDGGLRCEEVVQSINGVSDQFLRIIGGSGVLVSAVPAQNRLTIDVNLLNLALCVEEVDESSFSDYDDSEDECDCGSI